MWSTQSGLYTEPALPAHGQVGFVVGRHKLLGQAKYKICLPTKNTFCDIIVHIFVQKSACPQNKTFVILLCTFLFMIYVDFGHHTYMYVHASSPGDHKKCWGRQVTKYACPHKTTCVILLCTCVCSMLSLVAIPTCMYMHHYKVITRSSGQTGADT